jgi:anthranilate phosphoribosyltransferase
MSGKMDTAQIVSLLEALSKKGETAEELAAAARVMRSHAAKISAPQKIILDTCGTGADQRGTFNISTAVAFVAAGAGVAVAKHGNRSVSSKSGSADCLEALGVNINLSVEEAQQCLGQAGVVFLFAQAFHPAMKFAMPARRLIAGKTIFNLLGPLSNPASATHQLVGVYDAKWLQPLAQALGETGAARALVVRGEDGLDEITTTCATQIAEYKNGAISLYRIAPEDFAIRRAKLGDLSGGTPFQNSEILTGILNGENGPRRDIVVLNAAAALYCAERAPSIKEGISLAEESIGSKKALEKLALLKKFSLKR